jgi:hypothetical protein
LTVRLYFQKQVRPDQLADPTERLAHAELLDDVGLHVGAWPWR